ncbi:MAG: hypothetical protein ACLUYK_05515, partial [Eggerthella lenta]
QQLQRKPFAAHKNPRRLMIEGAERAPFAEVTATDRARWHFRLAFCDTERKRGRRKDEQALNVASFCAKTPEYDTGPKSNAIRPRPRFDATRQRSNSRNRRQAYGENFIHPNSITGTNGNQQTFNQEYFLQRPQ